MNLILLNKHLSFSSRLQVQINFECTFFVQLKILKATSELCDMKEVAEIRII